MIIFPVLFTMTLSFMFASSVEALTVAQLRLNCPLPIYNGDVTNLDIINDVQANYTVTFSQNMTANGARFQCFDDSVTHAPEIAVSSEQYGLALGDCDIFCIPIGWIGYLSHTMTGIFDKIVAFGTLIYLITFAPAQVSGLSFFIYIQAVLFSFIAFGSFMVIRGG